MSKDGVGKSKPGLGGVWNERKLFSWIQACATRISPTLGNMVRDDMVTTYTFVLGCMAFLWIIFFFYIDQPVLVCVAIMFTVAAFGTMLVPSVGIAILIFTGVFLVSFVTLGFVYGSCHNHYKTIIGHLILTTPLVLRSVSSSLFFFVVVVFLSGVMNLESLCAERPPYFTAAMSAAIDVCFALMVLVFACLYEMERNASDAARSKFVASVSHELRTPLNGIICAAELILEKEYLSAEDAQDVGTIFGCGQLMCSLINNILDAEVFHSKKTYGGVEKGVTFDAEEVSYKRYLFKTPDNWLSLLIPL